MSIRRAQDERIEGTPDGLNAITEIMDVPDAPTIGTAVDNGNLGVAVTFTTAVTGGTPATYTVTSTPGSITGTGSSSPITVSGLTAGTAYTFKVKGANAAGTFGPESSASNSVTPAFPVIGSYDALASTTLSSTASTVTFSGIPTGYKHLQIRYSLTAAGAADTTIRFNGDAGSNYSSHLLRGNASAGLAQAYSYTSQSSAFVQFNIGYNTSVAVIDILDYQNINKNKTIRSIAGWDNGTSSNGEMDLWSGAWYNTGAITSLVLTAATTTFSVNSTFALYGVK